MRHTHVYELDRLDLDCAELARRIRDSELTGDIDNAVLLAAELDSLLTRRFELQAD